jgi:hypothetical protein
MSGGIISVPIIFCGAKWSFSILCGSHHHGMVCSWVAEGGDNLHIWRVIANILNKESCTANKGWSSSMLGLDKGLTTPHHKKPACYEMLHRASELDGWVLWENLGNGKQM